MEKIKKAIEEPLKNLNLEVYKVEYKDNNLNIVLDSNEVIDLNRIVEATHIINKVLDEKDFIKEKYMLDVSSREKGDVK